MYHFPRIFTDRCVTLYRNLGNSKKIDQHVDSAFYLADKFNAAGIAVYVHLPRVAQQRHVQNAYV